MDFRYPVGVLPAEELHRRGEKLLKRMRRRWPKAFADPPVPLKIGIRKDLLAAKLSSQDVDVFLTWWVNQPDYLMAQMLPDAVRIDLDGNPCGPVSPENRQYAAAQIERWRYALFRAELVGDGQG